VSQPLLYKYRSLENWKFLVDILVNKRLYAASFHMLNDPMEGRYLYSADEVTKAFRSSIQRQKKALRICSLTEDPLNTLMWSYYAGGHSGVVLGFDEPIANPPFCDVKKVTYDNYLSVGPDHMNRDARDVALEILSQKQLNWVHEKEVRVFCENPYVTLELKEVRLGCRVTSEDEHLLRILVDKTTTATVSRVRDEDLDIPPQELTSPT
jgi:hypothetical protein